MVTSASEIKSTKKKNYLRLYSEAKQEVLTVLHGISERIVIDSPWAIGEDFKGYMALMQCLKEWGEFNQIKKAMKELQVGKEKLYFHCNMEFCDSSIALGSSLRREV